MRRGYYELLWTNGVSRMWYASAGYVQNERGEWVRRRDDTAEDDSKAREVHAKQDTRSD
ncbi:MAG TPA: hypothetical protein V6D08_21535 [Candidatus Obscuribacterales bacterium]